MFIIKIIILLIIFSTSSFIGILISKKYSNRVKDLKEIKASLNVFLTKIKFTYEPIPEIFKEIAKNTTSNISTIFENASSQMKEKQAGQAWIDAIEQSSTELSKEDKNILKGMSKLLGKTSIEGQISEIELTQNFLSKQIEKAEQEKLKNEKLYRTLGMTIGLAIVILLL